MKIGTKKIILPHLTITKITTETDIEATSVTISRTGEVPDITYYVKPTLVAADAKQRDGNPRWVKHQFNFFPVVMDCIGTPWAEASVYILSRLESVVAPTMTTYVSIAEDLSNYRRFLDDTGLDWTQFPSDKFSRPTYRFNAHLKFAVAAGELAATTARKRMGTVIGFYRWLKVEGVLSPEYPTWKESDRYIDFLDAHGFKHTKRMITTDISIQIPKQLDPYDGTIDDSGKLRPLPKEEQEWLMGALMTLGNTEMTLIHLFGLLTGARIQTILTFRIRHVMFELDDNQQGELRFPIGPGTGIDTKHDKQMVLHIPIWFYLMLQTYAHSTRARKRRERAVGGSHENQYLFLSVRGVPLYQSKEAVRSFDETNKLRHVKAGQGVRQFITERIIPYVRATYGVKNFHYQFHDTRATAGMNWTDHQLELIEQGKATLKEVREFVKTRMGHESAATTDRYLQYRRNLKFVSWAGQEYECHLRRLAEHAMEGSL